MIWPILFMVGVYLVIGWIVLLFYNIGQIKKYGHLIVNEEGSAYLFWPIILWPLAIIVFAFIWATKLAHNFAEHWYQQAADKKAAKIVKEAKLRVAERAAKLLDENNYKRDDTTNFESGIHR